MPDLIATRDMRYATRALSAGEPFQANNRDARLLVALKRATLAPADAQAEPAAPSIEELRDQAAKLGISVHVRWGEKRLQDEIAKAQAG